MKRSEIIERIAKAAEAVHDAAGDTMDLYATARPHLYTEELKKIGSLWRQLSKTARELRELELDATIGK